MMAPLLTFDDGPSQSTEQILDLLAEHGIKAAFFVIGFRAGQQPELVKRAADDGHIIGNHTWDHVNLTGFSDHDVLLKLRQTNEMIEQITGSTPTIFRAPWLQIDDRVLRLAQTLGLEHMHRDVDSCDYSDKPEHDVNFVGDAILGSRSGEIVLLHDGVGDDRTSPTNPPRPKTVEAVRQALPRFSAHWFQ
jgi:peptidoglycan/xylan/chitin deacetylase (PgdA/CDA1 family)